RRGQRLCVEYIDHHRLDSSGAQSICLGGRAGRADHVVPCVEQQRPQPSSNRACCSGQENFHVNHSTWDLPCQNLVATISVRTSEQPSWLRSVFIKSSAVALLGAT